MPLSAVIASAEAGDAHRQPLRPPAPIPARAHREPKAAAAATVGYPAEAQMSRGKAQGQGGRLVFRLAGRGSQPAALSVGEKPQATVSPGREVGRASVR